ncbi:Polyprotein-like protein [Theobroma cacao]|uniref:Polyprotein-like protein n=1 Tax=Theobroma cacao TaxID=3641 RepID=A0A061E9I5_THECC|nr:Polyprotein-like protein [Theobroma cacao]
MANFNPLSKILDDNRLSGPYYIDWQRNLTIVLTIEKIAYVLTTDPPELPKTNATDEQKNAFSKWHDADELAKCYILASMTNVLQMQHQGLATARDMIYNLQEMFGEQNRSARQAALKGLMSTKMVEGSPVCEHVLKMISFINELEMLGAKMDAETKMVVTLSELLNMLRVTEDLIKKNDKPVIVLTEKASDSKFKPKSKNKNNTFNGSKFSKKNKGGNLNKAIEKKKILEDSHRPSFPQLLPVPQLSILLLPYLLSIQSLPLSHPACSPSLSITQSPQANNVKQSPSQPQTAASSVNSDESHLDISHAIQSGRSRAAITSTTANNSQLGTNPQSSRERNHLTKPNIQNLRRSSNLIH